MAAVGLLIAKAASALDVYLTVPVTPLAKP
jgi:hypothetical protein